MLSRARAGLLESLRRRRFREREGLFLAEGVRVVEELLASGLDLRFAVASSSLEDTPRGAALRQRLSGAVETVEVGDADLARLAATESPQGVLAVARIPDWRLEAMSAGDGTVLVLDGVQDPGNLGTLLRTADALGVRFAVCLPGTADPWNPKAVRAAAGSVFRLRVVQADVDATFGWLREHGYAAWGADMGGAPAESLALGARAALVVGNEGAGLTDGVRAAVNGLVSVPIRGGAESLNVGVAAGILLYLFTRSTGA